jgi:hypothetical protein
MKLVGVQLERLQAALLSAFYDWDRLQDLLYYKLRKPLDEITAPGAMPYVLTAVIRWADGEGRLEELVTKAREKVPGNPALRAFALEAALTRASDLSPGSPFRRELEKAVLSVVGFYDAAGQRARQARCERTVCRIELGESGPWGTGFLVGPDTVLTNYHVIEDVDVGARRPEEITLRFDYALGPDGRTSAEGTPRKLAAGRDWLLAFSPEGDRDFALLRLDQPIGAVPSPDQPTVPWGWLTPTPYPFASNDPEPLFILQHPQLKKGEPTHPLKVTVGFIPPQVVDRRVTYTTNTLKGSSGSPCLRVDWE